MDKKERQYDYPEINSVRSVTETTGGIPSLPQNDEEYESYQEIVNLETPINMKYDDNKYKK